MSEVNEPNEETQVDELTTLKNRANQMGIQFHPNIGLEKLREKVAAALEPKKPEITEAPVEPSVGPVDSIPKVESNGQRKARKRREASALVRVRVTCMNPNKKEWEGELFTVGNSTIGTFRRYVPFNAEDGWHVERAILNMMQARECQVFYTAKGPRGNKVRKGKLVKEFNIEILEPLNEKELSDLAKRQAMADNLD